MGELKMKTCYLLLGATNQKCLQGTIRNSFIGFCKYFDVVGINTFKQNSKFENLFGKAKCKIDNVDFANFGDWLEVESRFKDYIKQSGMQNLLVYGFPILSGIKKDDIGIAKKFIKDYKTNPTKSINFMLLRTIFTKLIFIKCALEEGINVLHYVVDPQEVVFNDLFEDYDIKRLYYMNRSGYNYVPSFEYMMFRNARKSNRLIDFIFYGTIYTKDREWLMEMIQNFDIPNSDIKCITKSNQTISQLEYYKRLWNSKFTLVIPSYDKTTFSLIRVYEALINGCIPFVLNTCCLGDVEATMPDMVKFIKKFLIVNNQDDIKRLISEYSGKEDKIIEKMFGIIEDSGILYVEKGRKIFDKILK